MNVPIKLDETRLHIFHEGRKRRVFVGELSFDKKTTDMILSITRAILAPKALYRLVLNLIFLNYTINLRKEDSFHLL